MSPRDHGGGLDAAIARFGGARADWLDLSTGINPTPYPLPDFSDHAWSALPDAAATERLVAAARRFWCVPDAAGILAAPGLSSVIARLPSLAPPGRARVPGPTYNEHAAAFRAAGWSVDEGGVPDCRDTPDALVAVHPNNPDGRLLGEDPPPAALVIIDESFCDLVPDRSLIRLADRPGTLILKSFGKFWGLAGLRLGFAIGDPDLLARLREALGPWPVSGPALEIGAAALDDADWAGRTRRRLDRDAVRLDAAMAGAGAVRVGGTSLFRLFDVGDAAAWHARLASHRILGRVFPSAPGWLRLGLPPADRFERFETALGTAGGATAQPSAGRRARSGRDRAGPPHCPDPPRR